MEMRNIAKMEKIALAHMNVGRLLAYLSFVNRQALAAGPSIWDTALPEVPRNSDREDFSALALANAPDDMSSSLPPPIFTRPSTTSTVTMTTTSTASSAPPPPMDEDPADI